MSVGPIQTTHTQAGAMAGAGTTDQSTIQQVPSTHKGSGGRATEKRSASDCAAVLSLEHGKVSSDRRRGVHFYICACTIMQRCPTCFRHDARSCKGVLHVFDTSPAPRVGTGCARPLMPTFSIISMDTSHASPFICSLLKTTYVALSRNNLPNLQRQG